MAFHTLEHRRLSLALIILFLFTFASLPSFLVFLQPRLNFMTISLDRLPFDVLFHVASSLQFDDMLHLSFTCRQLRLLLEESTLCRKAIEEHAPYSKEAQLARDRSITYGQAIKSVYDRRSAFSNAHPFSARNLGQGTAFLFRQGILCVLNGSRIRISDTHSSSGQFEFDVYDIVEAQDTIFLDAEDPKLSLLFYSDGIIAVLYEFHRLHSYILVLDVKAGTADDSRLVEEIPIEDNYRLFVRHTSSFLYYGTYTGVGRSGHHEWEIRGVSLPPGSSNFVCAPPIQLEDFFGTDIGSTIAFEIHDNHFYAISNQTSFDVEELDWTSFYHCIRFPLDQPYFDYVEINPRIYRRQHKEGPIHDSWTDLTIQIDECTNEPVIVEARREWQNGSSRQFRTFYISPIPSFGAKSTTTSRDESPSTGAVADIPMLPLDDRFTELLDSSNKPNYAPWQPRYSWNFHPEFESSSVAESSRSFILARTKFRAYNYSCTSFIDLVEDERCCPDTSPTSACLRIRIGSRRIAPLDWAPDGAQSSTSLKGKEAVTDAPMPGTEKDALYRHSSIKMWPPPASRCPCSKRLHNILSPHGSSQGRGNRVVTGVVDERSLVYMVKNGRSYGEDDNALGTIVLVSFNRDARSGEAEGEKGMQTHAESREWHWSPGQASRCQRREC